MTIAKNNYPNYLECLKPITFLKIENNNKNNDSFCIFATYNK